MKKIIFMLAGLMAFSLVNAQISGGLKGGLNFANANVDLENVDTDGKTGYHVGAFAEIGLGGISLMPEILYSFKGTDDLDLTYIEIPILLKKNFAKIVNIHAGPQFGILTNAETETAIGDIDLKDLLNGSDVSIILGAGVDLPLGISAGARYVYGLTDINDKLDFGDLTEDIPKITNRTFQLYVGYKLFGN